MKLLKDNMWNRLFHGKELMIQFREQKRMEERISKARAYLSLLEKCDTLRGLLELHKEIWNSGIRNKCLGPDKYGMFRTEDISSMDAAEVYLGDIYGLWTFPIPEWEKEGEHKFGGNMWGIDPDIPVVQIVVCQYRNLLVSNVRTIMNDAMQFVKDCKSMTSDY